MKNFSQKRILVLDEDTTFRETFRNHFESYGATVLGVANIHHAVEQLSLQSFDVVISEVKMKEGNGLELIDRVKSQHSKFPFFILVSNLNDCSPQEAFSKGASAFFSKPFDIENIAQAIDHLSYNPEDHAPRSHLRIETQLPIAIKSSQLIQETSGQLLNISQGGIFVKMPGPLPSVGSSIHFSVNIQESDPQNFEGQAIVRWHQHHPLSKLPQALGAEFFELSPSCASTLFYFLCKLQFGDP